jgi:N-acetylglutamate synthase-like GNAT family acetyltransferase
MFDSKELFRALEFAHYAERFRGETFVIALPAGASFAELLLDFKVLAGYRIGLVLVTEDPDFILDGVISKANQRGARFDFSIVTDLIFSRETSETALDFTRIQKSLGQGKTPVIAYQSAGKNHGAASLGGGTEPLDTAYILAAAVARQIEPRKLFLVHSITEPLKRLLPQGAVLEAELDQIASQLGRKFRAEAVSLLGFIRENLVAGIPDVVLIRGITGELFREVFTHDGAGVIFNASMRSEIRKAELSDVTDIALLLRSDIEAGRILPRTENSIEANIGAYWIYEIDGMGVGLACLHKYGEEAEMSQFSTLPRYRGKGRAKELARLLIAEAREQGYRGVFALSIDERMWEFFLSLGFQRVARESLPEGWRGQYDMNRDSRAFRMELT